MLTFASPRLRAVTGLAAAAVIATACGSSTDTTDGPTSDPTTPDTASSTDDTPDAEGSLVVYSGRDEELVGGVIEDFEAASGIDVEVRYGGTSELAATILEEGGSSPADVYWAQDAGALGALAKEGRLQELPQEILDRVDPSFASPAGEWVGVTGRVRVLVYNTEALAEDEVPDSVFELTDEAWRGRVGWAPTNGSFQSFITAMRELEGDEVTEQWVKDMLANDVQEYPNNSSQVDAAGRGEIDLGLVNHYYLFRFLAEDPDFPAANKFLASDPGGLVNVSGVGILDSSPRSAAAQQFVDFLLAQEAQTFFGSVTDELEYPLAVDVEADPGLPALSTLQPPTIDLSDLDDLEGTLELLRRAGALS